MSEDETKIIENSPLLRRILQSQERVEEHIKTLEANFERLSMNTRPIWEKALAEIVEVKQSVASLSRKIDVFNSDMLNVRADQREHDERINRLESEAEGGVTMIG